MTFSPAASPDASVLRVQVCVVARGRCRAGVADALAHAAGAAATGLGDAARVIVLTEIDDDPFPAANPRGRPFDAVLEVQGAAAPGAAPYLGALTGLADRLATVAHLDLSGVLVGAPQEIIPCPPQPLRYQYFMRRRAGLARADYLHHYFHRHSRFGFRTPAAGYTQLHVDPDASAAAARRLGFGTTVCDSVSELHLESLEAFYAGLMADPDLGAEAVADEETFVDREHSVSTMNRSRLVRR